MSSRATKLKMPELAAQPKFEPMPAKAVQVADPLAHMAQNSSVHAFQAEIERAYSTRRSIGFDTKKVPFIVTLIGACAFSAACWAAVIGVISAL